MTRAWSAASSITCAPTGSRPPSPPSPSASNPSPDVTGPYLVKVAISTAILTGNLSPDTNWLTRYASPPIPTPESLVLAVIYPRRAALRLSV